jgi:hypothetical protein
MFNDHKKISAVASASFCVRLVTASVLACGAFLAHAESGDAPRREQPQHQQGGPRNDQRASDNRQLDPRSYEARAEEQRRAMQEASRNAEMSRRVGQDLYANPPRR